MQYQREMKQREKVAWQQSYMQVCKMFMTVFDKPISWSMATIVQDFVMCTRRWAISLAMITMRKSIHEFPFLSCMGMVLHFAALWTTWGPL